MRLFSPKGPKDVLKASKQNVKESIRELDRELTVSRKRLYSVSIPSNDSKDYVVEYILAGHEKRGSKTNRRDQSSGKSWQRCLCSDSSSTNGAIKRAYKADTSNTSRAWRRECFIIGKFEDLT